MRINRHELYLALFNIKEFIKISTNKRHPESHLIIIITKQPMQFPIFLIEGDGEGLIIYIMPKTPCIRPLPQPCQDAELQGFVLQDVRKRRIIKKVRRNKERRQHSIITRF